ncbi:WD-40 repeat family protein / beige protein [Trifolium repens]|nr:WD-40 repeat family protein / beige protein [Trifolium repens]
MIHLKQMLQHFKISITTYVFLCFTLLIITKKTTQAATDLCAPVKKYVFHLHFLFQKYFVSSVPNIYFFLYNGRLLRKQSMCSVNVFYHYTYEGSVDIDSVTDPAMKASILAQINHFGQTPKQMFLKAHVKRRIDKKLHAYQKMTKLKRHLMMKIDYK